MQFIEDRLPSYYSGFVTKSLEPNDIEQGEYVYYADFNKRWKFYTSKAGVESLLKLFQLSIPILDKIQEEIEKQGSPKQIEEEGAAIYSKKPNKQYGSVTWSQEEYRHPGFLKQYIILKSIQRYAESYSMYQRAYNAGYFESYINRNSDTTITTPKVVRMISVGGGPGYELIAFRHFFETICPNYKVELVSLDCEEFWKPHCKQMNIEYATWDMLDDTRSIQDVLRELYCQKKKDEDESINDNSKIEIPFIELHVDFYMYSYVFNTYFTTEEQRDFVAKLAIINPFSHCKDAEIAGAVETPDNFAKGLIPKFGKCGSAFYNSLPTTTEKEEPEHVGEIDTEKVYGFDKLNPIESLPVPGPPLCVFVSDRGQSVAAYVQIASKYRNELKVAPLMPQQPCRDDRQTVFVSRGVGPIVSLTGTDLEVQRIFPNQPYEEHKQTSKFKYQHKVQKSQRKSKHFDKFVSNHKKNEHYKNDFRKSEPKTRDY